MKRKICLIFMVMLLLTNGISVYASENIDGKYSGTYKMTSIYINNINSALKELNVPVSYSDGSEDYASFPLTVRLFDDPKGSLILEDMIVGTSSVILDGDNIKIEFMSGYYGYTDELNVIYVLEGVRNDNEISGTFYGLITQTGKLECEGTFKIKSGSKLNSFGNSKKQKEEKIEKYIPVNDLLFDTITKEIKVNHKEKLKVTVFPSDATNKAVTFTTSNYKVVRVDQVGTIVAQDVGTASITVSSLDNPNIFNVMEIKVTPNTDDVPKEDIDKVEIGMTFFDENDKENEDKNFTSISIEKLPNASIERAKDTIDKLEDVSNNNPNILLEKNEANTGDGNLPSEIEGIEIVNVSAKEKIDSSVYNNTDDFMQDAKETMRKIGKPANETIGKIIDKIPKVAGIDVFHEFAKDKIDESILGLDDRREKTDSEIKEQLQKNLSVDNEHFALKYLKKKAETNIFVKIFAYPINKIFGIKKTQYKEVAFIEYKSVRDKINKNIKNGMTKEEAIKHTKNDFVYNDNHDTTFDAIDNAKPGLQRFMAIRQGGKENQMVTGTKSEYQSNENRFDKYVELFDKNLEFEEVE